jgi:hypothetical protein
MIFDDAKKQSAICNDAYVELLLKIFLCSDGCAFTHRCDSKLETKTIQNKKFVARFFCRAVVFLKDIDETSSVSLISQNKKLVFLILLEFEKIFLVTD